MAHTLPILPVDGARLAEFAYDQNPENLREGWKLLKTSDVFQKERWRLDPGEMPPYSHGYSGVAVVREDLKTVVISNKGSSTPLNFLSDAELVFQKIPAAQEAADAFSNSVRRWAQAHQFKVVHVGHSLGGAHAVFSAYAHGENAFIFDAPGTQQILTRHYGHLDPAKTAKIFSFLAEPNAINRLGEQVGTVFHLRHVGHAREIIDDAEKKSVFLREMDRAADMWGAHEMDHEECISAESMRSLLTNHSCANITRAIAEGSIIERDTYLSLFGSREVLATPSEIDFRVTPPLNLSSIPPPPPPHIPSFSDRVGVGFKEGTLNFSLDLSPASRHANASPSPLSSIEQFVRQMHREGLRGGLENPRVRFAAKQAVLRELEHRRQDALHQFPDAFLLPAKQKGRHRAHIKKFTFPNPRDPSNVLVIFIWETSSKNLFGRTNWVQHEIAGGSQELAGFLEPGKVWKHKKPFNLLTHSSVVRSGPEAAFQAYCKQVASAFQEAYEAQREVKVQDDRILEGYSGLERGDWEGAQRSFEEALAYDPSNLSIKKGLAYLFAQKGDHSSALPFVKEILQQEKDLSLLLYSARVHGSQKNLDQANALYRAYFEGGDVVDSIAKLEWATVCCQTGNVEKGVQLASEIPLSQGAHMDKNKAHTVLRIAMMGIKTTKVVTGITITVGVSGTALLYDTARYLKLCQIAMHSAPKDVEILVESAKILNIVGEKEKATELIDKAMEIDPEAVLKLSETDNIAQVEENPNFVIRRAPSTKPATALVKGAQQARLAAASIFVTVASQASLRRSVHAMSRSHDAAALLFDRGGARGKVGTGFLALQMRRRSDLPVRRLSPARRLRRKRPDSEEASFQEETKYKHLRRR